MSDGLTLAPVVPDLVWFSGDDALRFLNDLISQEIGDLAEGETRRSFLLGPQGKLEFLLWVIKDGQRFGLVTDHGRGGELAAYLGRYRIRVDVEIDQEQGPVSLVMGEVDGYDVSWPGVKRTLVLGAPPALPTMSDDEYTSARVGAGEPEWEIDVDSGTIPHESGLVPVSVDFDKGCFLGQELVARIDSRGSNTPRQLRLVEIGDGHLDTGAIVTVGDREVGVVTSASGRAGLAMIRREVGVGDRVEVAGAPGLIRDLPAKPQR